MANSFLLPGGSNEQVLHDISNPATVMAIHYLSKVICEALDIKHHLCVTIITY